jgi:hypothetical protein
MFKFGQLSRRLAVLVLLGGVVLTGRAATRVFQGGRVLMPVFIAPNATPEERAAAQELARVLEIMSGLPWPVSVEKIPATAGFYVGWTQEAARQGDRLKPAADLLAPKPGEIAPDGFRIRSMAGKILLEGATPEATGFAVAWLLQQEGGVRWYAPGPAGEMIPRRSEWSVAELNLVREPAYVSREIYGAETRDGTDWARHNGLRSRLEFNHALAAVFRPEVMAAHPEWRSLVRGERLGPTSANDQGWQPDLSRSDVADYAAAAAQAAFARDPGRTGFSLAMNDTVRFDQGAATRARVEPLHYFRGFPDYSPLVFTFMNRAGGSVARTNPGHYLGCLAYFWCENPPPFRVNPSVVPFVTTDRTQYYDRDYRAADLALMSRWAGSGVRTFGLWEYGEGANFLVPRVPLAALAEAVREGWRRGARGYFAEMEPSPGFDTFKAWMLAQLLWDPARSSQELADDFYAGYYGAAAAPMRRFFELCEARWMAQTGAPAWLKYYQQEDQALLFSPENCRQLRGQLNRAARLAQGDPAVAARVEQTSRAFAVTEAFIDFDTVRRKLFAMAADETAPRAETETAVADAIQRLWVTRARLREAFSRAREGAGPAMASTDLLYFTRNDPVPRLLWLAGRADPRAPQRILAAVGADASQNALWRSLAEFFLNGPAGPSKNLAANSSFARSAATGQEPRFLYPHSGAVPADWDLRAMPTETGKVSLIDGGAPGSGRALRMEGAWDTQLYQWLPAEPGRVYLATAQLRGRSSPGGDASLFLKFRTATGQSTGIFGMQSLPKGATAAWRSAVLADRAPADAAWVGIGAVATRQAPGDWLEVRAVELRDMTREEKL